MTDTPENVRVWSGGAVAYIDVDQFDADAPELDTLDEIPAGWSVVGLHDEDAGFSNEETSTITDFHARSARGSALVRTTVSKVTETITFSAVEENPNVFELIHPGAEWSTESDVHTASHGPLVPVTRAWIFDSYDSDGERIREIVPRGTVVSKGTVDRKSSTPTMFPLTVRKAVFDDEGNTQITKRTESQFAEGS